jgi:hypothetical protein
MSDSDDLKSLRQRAESAGLTKLTDAHLEQLQRATAANLRAKANLKVALSVADEPSHVFSLVEKGGKP